MLNKTWKQHPTKQQLYSHRHLIFKTIQSDEQNTRDTAGEVSGVLLETSSHGRAGVVRPARTDLQQLCTETGCSLEDLPNAIDERDKWRGRVWEIHAYGTTRWGFVNK